VNAHIPTTASDLHGRRMPRATAVLCEDAVADGAGLEFLALVTKGEA
jgi:hypothetical protein